MSEDLRMYILVNKDVKIKKGKLAGQVGHAVAVYFYKNIKNIEEINKIDKYMDTHQKKIILYCSQEKLEELENQGYISIRDKGWTSLNPNTLTCVNLGIIDYNCFPEKFKFIKTLKLVN